MRVHYEDGFEFEDEENGSRQVNMELSIEEEDFQKIVHLFKKGKYMKVDTGLLPNDSVMEQDCLETIAYDLEELIEQETDEYFIIYEDEQDAFADSVFINMKYHVLHFDKDNLSINLTYEGN